MKTMDDKRPQGPKPEGPVWIDSHAHLDMEDFDPDRDEVIRRAFAAGVMAVLCPADLTSDKSLRATLNIVAGHPSFLAAAGVHPHQAKLFSEDHARKLRDLGTGRTIAALGEIGLDFHYDFSTPEEQKRAFRDQLRLADELRLPVIIHSRLAGAEVATAVRKQGCRSGGILHCYTEDWDTARTMIDLGFYISFSGILTFPKAGSLREVAVKVPLDRLLIETDSPYLAPVPFRDRKRNEPAFVVETARVLADLKRVSLEKLAEATTGNFFSLFPGT
jgi:TatD DNase family protein